MKFALFPMSVLCYMSTITFCVFFFVLIRCLLSWLCCSMFNVHFILAHFVAFVGLISTALVEKLANKAIFLPVFYHSAGILRIVFKSLRVECSYWKTIDSLWARGIENEQRAKRDEMKRMGKKKSAQMSSLSIVSFLLFYFFFCCHCFLATTSAFMQL